MKIKLLSSVTVGGVNAGTHSTGTVLEAKEEADIAEYKALVAVGHAEETSAKVTDPADYANSAGGNVRQAEDGSPGVGEAMRTGNVSEARAMGEAVAPRGTLASTKPAARGGDKA